MKDAVTFVLAVLSGASIMILYMDTPDFIPVSMAVGCLFGYTIGSIDGREAKIGEQQ